MLSITATRTKEITSIILGVFLLSAFSQVTIPLQPVPVVLATVGVMLIGITYNMQAGMTTILAYVISGVVGLPILANYSGGLQVLYGPTGGYIIGYIVAVYTMNKLKPVFDRKTALGIFLNCLCGTTTIFVCGIPWLAVHIGFEGAVIHGLLPFIIPGFFKAIILTATLRGVRYFKK